MSLTSTSAPIEQTRDSARRGLYHGWINMFMASVAMTATLPGRTHGLGLITKQLTEDPTLGVGDSLFSYLNFWAVIVGAAICWPVGVFIDRWGVRIVHLWVVTFLGISVAAMSQSTDWFWLLVSLTVVRGFGQGALSVVSLAMIGKWFTERLPVAMGLFSVLLAIGFMVTIPGTDHFVQIAGWRKAWLGISGCLLVGLAPLGWILIRSTPESLGHTVEFQENPKQSLVSSPVDATVSSALSTRSFWVLTLGAALFNLTWSAVMLFQEKLLKDRGFDHSSFLLVMTLMVVTGIPVNMVTGWLAKPRRIGLLLMVGLLVLAGALISFPWLCTKTGVLFYGLALGVSGGIITVIFFTAYGQTFGRTHLGKIQSIVQVFTTFASAIGPVLLTSTMSADLTWVFFDFSAFLAIVLAAMAMWLRLPSADEASVSSGL